MKVFNTNTAEETNKVGQDFAQELVPGDVLLFYGNLGAGKTTFVQGLALGLGIKDRILSPTFVIQRSHKVNGKAIKVFNHIDLYRIEGNTEIENLGIDELLNDQESVTVIEWAEKLKSINHEKGYKIKFSYVNKDSREIEIEGTHE